MSAGAPGTFEVVMRNDGTATWDDQFRLGTVGDMAGDGSRFEELAGYPDVGRIHLAAGATVAPGQTYAFRFAIVAPTASRAYDVKFRMVHENVQWFGDTATQAVTVTGGAAPTTPAPATPAAGADEIDLSQAVIHNSAGDAASWAVTAKLTQLSLQANGVHIDFTKRDGPQSWPDVPDASRWAPGDSIEYTLWIVIKVNGQWHASGCIEYWRGADRNGGPPSGYAQNWYYDAGRWGAMTGHQPAVGEQVGFFVTAGDERNSGLTIVKERSNVILVPFPSDSGANISR